MNLYYKKKIYVLWSICFLWSPALLNSQLKPGFDKAEYRELMYVSARSTADSGYYNKFPLPAKFHQLYQSKSIGLDNMWDFWESDNQAVISIRGTTSKQISWLANFFAGMVPAKGNLRLNDSTSIDYKLAEDPRAAVHVGWLIGTLSLSNEMLPWIEISYRKGIKDILIIGHSQGGAIAYLLTSYLYQKQIDGTLPKDIRFKTYCSAAPKPGNLYYAYDYEDKTRGGWAFNVVNAKDWVPETPISIQTIHDFNVTNPFANAPKAIRNQKFPANIVMKSIFNQLDKSTRKAQRKYEKYLGRKAYSLVKKQLPGLRIPNLVHSSDYVRTGATIVLMPDEVYNLKYPDDPNAIFRHHLHQPYLDLIEKYKP